MVKKVLVVDDSQAEIRLLQSVVTVDKALFGQRVGVMPTHVMSRVENGLRMVLGL